MKINDQDPSIVEFKKTLDLDFCKKVIYKFNKDSRTQEGQVFDCSSKSIKNKLTRQAQILNISEYKDWKQEDNIFFTSLSTHLTEYLNHVHKIFYKLPFNCPPVDSGYQIQKTMILFPSNLEHSVDENFEKLSRITISFNSFPSGQVGLTDSLAGIYLDVL